MDLPELLHALAHGESDSRRIQAIRAIVEVGSPPDPAILGALQEACTDPSSLVAYHARRAMDELGCSPLRVAGPTDAALAEATRSSWLRKLREDITGPEPAVRLNAVTRAIERGEPDALPLLRERLAVEDHAFVLSKLTLALGLLGGASVLDQLIPFLSHSDARIRANTVEGLGTTRDPEVFKVLIGQLEDPDHRVRANVVRSLKEYRDFDRVGMLMEMSQSASPGDRSSALYVLSRISEQRALEAVAELLEDPEVTIADRAWEIIEARAGTAPEMILERLEKISLQPGVDRERLLGRLSALEAVIGGSHARSVREIRARLLASSGARGRPEIDGPEPAAPRPGSAPTAASVPTDDYEPPPIGPVFVGVETEFDELSEIMLKARLDEVERGPDAVAQLGRAAQSRRMTVRLEARRRLTRARRTVERQDGRRSRRVDPGRVALSVLFATVLAGGLVLCWFPRAIQSRSVATPSPLEPPADPRESRIPSPSPSPRAAHAPASLPSPSSNPGRRLLSTPGILDYDISADGRELLVSACTRTKAGPAVNLEPRHLHTDIQRGNLYAGETRPITANGRSQSARFWGEEIAWIDGEDGMGDLVYLAEEKARWLTQGLKVSEATRSPDGRRAAMVVEVISNGGQVLGGDVALIDLSGGRTTTSLALLEGKSARYLTTTGKARFPRFSRKSSHLAYFTQEDDEVALAHVLEVEKGKEWSTRLDGTVLESRWVENPDRLVVLTLDRTRAALSTIEPGKAPRPLFALADGRQIAAFGCGRSGYPMVACLTPYPRNSGASGPMALPGTTQTRPSTLAGDLWLLSPDGGLAEQLTRGADSSQPCVDSGGRALVYVRGTGDGAELWFRPLPGQVASRPATSGHSGRPQ